MWVWFVGGAVAAPLPEMTLRLPEMKLDAYEMCWPSGLKIQAVRRPNTALVSVATVVAGGHAAEGPGERGAAHLVEHLWFQSRPQGSSTVDDVLSGLTVQGNTGADSTGFVTIAAPEDLRALLNIEALRLIDPLANIDDDTVARERRLVHHEHLYRSEHVAGVALQALFGALFPAGSAYATPPTLADNDALTLEPLRRYAARQYRPEHTTIRVEGELAPQGVEALVRAVFPPALLGGNIRACVHPSGTADPPPLQSPDLLRVEAATDPALVFGWSLPAGFVSDNDVLGSMAAGWLQDSLAYSIGIARGMDDTDVALSCDYGARQQNAVILCSTPLADQADPASVVKRIRVALDARRRELSANEDWLLRSVRAFDGALAVADAFDADALIDRARFAHHVDGEIDPLFRTTRALHTIGVKELGAFAARWLTAERMAVVVLQLGPVRIEDQTELDGRAVLEVSAQGPWRAPTVSLDDWRVVQAPDGLDVWVIPRPGAPPYAQSTVWFTVGGAAGAPAGWWADHTMADFEMHQGLEILNATATLYGWENHPGAHAVWGEGPSGNLDAQLYALRNLLGPITYVGRGADLREAHALARAELPQSPSPVANALRARHLFPSGHPYGEAWWDLDERARALTRDDVKAWRQGVIRPEHGTVVVTGRVHTEQALANVREYLGDWRAGGAAIASSPPPPADPRQRKGFAWSYPMHYVNVACRVAGRDARTDAASDVLQVLLQRGMEQTLREGGGAYLTLASVTAMDPHTAVLNLTTQVGPMSGRLAVDALVNLLEQVAAGPSEALLDWGRRAALNQHAERLASTAGAHDLALDAVAAGLTIEELQRYPERLQAVDAAAIWGLLAPCIGHEIATVVGPEIELGADSVWVDWRAQAARAAE